jgi:alpha-glucosidase
MKVNQTHNSIFIRKFLLISILLFLSFQQFADAQESNTSFTYQLKNKKYLNVQVCSDHIIRVRVAAKEEFTPTLMEKYGILKTDWNAVKVSSKKEKGNRIISSSGFQFILNEDSGELSVKDASVVLI